MRPSDEDQPRSGDDATVSPLEELRERLRPRVIGDRGVTAGERLALERVQALELQVATTHRRERELLELAVKDGNTITALRAEADSLRELAARAEAAERAVFESETQAEAAIRRAELMESELMSTRAEVDRLRTRIVELEASLRRALAEVGEVTSRHAEARPSEQVPADQTADRSLELADQLRLKVVDLESSLRAVMSDISESETAGAIADRASEEAVAAEIERAAEIARTAAGAAAEERLADLEERLAALDDRISSLGSSFVSAGAVEATDEGEPLDDGTEERDLFLDLSSEEEPEVEDLAPEPIKPPASRWSDWRTT